MRNNIYNSQRLVNNYSVLHAGTNQYVTAARSNWFGITTNFSVSAWVRPFNVNVQRYMVSHTTSTNPAIADGFLLYHSNSGQPIFQVRAFNGATSGQNNIAMVVGTWYHLVGTYNGANVRLYTNGAPPTTTGSTTGIVVEDVSLFQTGRTPSAAASSHFIGCIDEVSVWNTALSQSDAIKLYNAGRPTNLLVDPNYANLRCWWRMGDGDVYPTIKDYSRRGNLSGTMTNMADGVNIRPETIWRG